MIYFILRSQDTKPIACCRRILCDCFLISYILCLSFCISGCSQIADKLIGLISTKEREPRPLPQSPVVLSPEMSLDRAKIETKQVLTQPSHEPIQQPIERSPTANTNHTPAPTTITAPPVGRYSTPSPHPSQPVDVSGMKSNDW